MSIENSIKKLNWYNLPNKLKDILKNLVGGQVTKTSDLQNDGVDGVNPFINANDIPVVPEYQAGANISIDDSNPLFPIINGTGGLTPTEGTFNPTLVDSVGGATYTYTMDNAEYIKVGKIVLYSIRFTNINTTGTPAVGLRIDGLPFPVKSGSRLNNVDIKFLLGSTISDSIIDRLTVVHFGTFNTVYNYDVGSIITNIEFTSGVYEISGIYLTNS